MKLQADSNILASPEAGRGNCLPYVLAPPSFPASQEDKYRDKINKINKISNIFNLAHLTFITTNLNKPF